MDIIIKVVSWISDAETLAAHTKIGVIEEVDSRMNDIFWIRILYLSFDSKLGKEIRTHMLERMTETHIISRASRGEGEAMMMWFQDALYSCSIQRFLERERSKSGVHFEWHYDVQCTTVRVLTKPLSTSY